MTHSGTPFDTVLVANRGEIACRILRTLRRLGIRSVAVYSDADRDARHAGEADVAVRIGPAAAQSSYLDVAAIISAARTTGATAIHPGYGFLSENPDLARACDAAGIAFIGPGVRALEVMGDKIRSKEHVAASGVPVIPGTTESRLGDDELVAAAEGVGFPLLIKPSAGGGGKGMQIVTRQSELPDALSAARRVARSAFGDDTLLLERLIASPRHIEVQVLADGHGNIVHLGERECSLQRRHQKVIEEAPSPLLDEATRARIGEAACAVARSVDYRGAGTIEFLISAESPGEFFFMEMNARLQVEHPVTELVTGIDLVEWQLRIAAGEPLTMTQADITTTGHAIEARVYAEHPERGFLPGTGTILALAEPEGDGIRVDSSLLPGLVITAHYDPMLAKVIAHGEDRAAAIARLDGALAATTVLGVTTNIEYLRLLLADPAVRAGELDTSLIERRLPELRFRHPDATALAAAALFLHAEHWSRGQTLWQRPSGWRVGEHRATGYRLGGPTGTTEVFVIGTPDAATVTIDGTEHPASLSGPGHLVELDGIATRWQLIRHGENLWLGQDGFSCRLTINPRFETGSRDRPSGPVSPEVRSPMPGTVVSVTAATGETVEAGRVLVTVEAMKMEHSLLAPVAGTVEITVSVGDLVKLDQLVATITEADPADSDPNQKGTTS